MHALIVKMSSMGDVLHTLPALTDALNQIPDLQIDWIVEPAFADIPTWHNAVNEVITLPLRKWRKNIFKSLRSTEFKALKEKIRTKHYDIVIDAQGLLKSAIITKLAHAPTHGLDRKSAREPLSRLFYQHTHFVDKHQHAIQRTRALFAKSLQYPQPSTTPDFAINTAKLPTLPFQPKNKYIVFIHGTTWATKHYPESYWKALLLKAENANIPVYLPWGNAAEKMRATTLAKDCDNAIVLPKLSIAEIATLLSTAQSVVSVDTGLGHLSAALNTPTISLYGPTNPARIGAVGKSSEHLVAKFQCAPCSSKVCAFAKHTKTEIQPACYTTIHPDMIWEKLTTMLHS